MAEKKGGGVERRKHRRRPVLDTFRFFAVIPQKGPLRLRIYDVSDEGMGFEVDSTAGEAELFDVRPGETINVQFYLNQSLYLPLSVQVVRVDAEGETRTVGAKFTDQDSRAFKAFTAFLNWFDEMLDVVRIDRESAEQG